jgi:hypothetical protein
MSKETRDFKNSMRKAFKVIEGKANNTTKLAFSEMFEAIIDDTPVGDPALWKTPHQPRGYRPGTLKSNWQTSIGSPRTSFIQEQQDPTGSSTKGYMKGTLAAWNFKQDLYFANSAPYVQQIEYGYSSQAPQGMYRLNVQKFNGLISKYARREDT